MRKKRSSKLFIIYFQSFLVVRFRGKKMRWILFHLKGYNNFLLISLSMIEYEWRTFFKGCNIIAIECRWSSFFCGFGIRGFDYLLTQKTANNEGKLIFLPKSSQLGLKFSVLIFFRFEECNLLKYWGRPVPYEFRF